MEKDVLVAVSRKAKSVRNVGWKKKDNTLDNNMNTSTARIMGKIA